MTEDAGRVRIAGPALEAAVRKTGYVSGVEGGSLLDVKTGFRDLGYGLDVVDWLMEPGSDAAYRDRLPGDLPYVFDNLVHGKRPKRCVEGPQICTRAGRLPDPRPEDGQDRPVAGRDDPRSGSRVRGVVPPAGYVCLIQEVGGRPVKPGESFGAAYVVGFFDSVGEMERVYDRYAGRRGLEVSESGWRLTRTP